MQRAKSKGAVRAGRREKASKESSEIQSLLQRIATESPPKGAKLTEGVWSQWTPLADAPAQPKAEATEKGNDATEQAPDVTNGPSAGAKAFSDLPLSHRTLQALHSAGYKLMTDIQRAAIPHALAGRDVLGAAKTGSGKTLAFLVPMLEKLFRERWSRDDGLGAVVLSPTRELALQTFDVLRKIGARHDVLSAGLVIGGTNFKEEQARVSRMNILVATPGRLLQHMDETPHFETSALQMLILDEADRILDMGFGREVNAILENFPRHRQTLLFSATQTTSVQQLARLSLQDPEFLSVHAQSKYTTPKKLAQSFLVAEAGAKVDILWAFIKAHLRKKTIVFVSSQKQCRYLYEAFRRLRPGVPLMHIHGKMNQTKRMAMYYEYDQSSSAVMFATDVAARGLDIQNIDWVIQFDCPDTVETYIHRVGRTARYQSGGHAILFLLPSEEPMVDLLAKAKIPLEKMRVNPSRESSIQASLQALLIKDAELKALAQKAVRSYLRSVHLQTNKDIFNVAALPIEKFAQSLGLLSTPKVKLAQVSKIDKHSLIMQQKLDAIGSDDDEEETATPKAKKVQAKAKAVKAPASDSEDSDDEFLTKKPASETGPEEESDEPLGEIPARPVSKSQLKKILTKINPHHPRSLGSHLHFNNSDEESDEEKVDRSDDEENGADEDDESPFIDQVVSGITNADEEHKQEWAQTLRERKLKRKLKRKERDPTHREFKKGSSTKASAAAHPTLENADEEDWDDMLAQLPEPVDDEVLRAERDEDDRMDDEDRQFEDQEEETKPARSQPEKKKRKRVSDSNQPSKFPAAKRVKR